ncbi:hypothetical protein SAMN05443999_11821 [Roseovarius azorensis]|uniref:Uncharacterized protein n=1 Tax=Roseovarius azorensis TaxID=1287727 RepID=A0A1H7X291_9RHOB|nr:hypothetical protein [Roseovarius azorensis]SEM27721.1 hypothetical protein SAMN05443999_11821 [Roseovarius azorensis]
MRRRRFAVDPDLINADRLVSGHPFQHRKRGVETKIVLADAPAGRDETLIRNIARAHAVAHVFGEHSTQTFGSHTVPYISPERVQESTWVRILIAKDAISTG